MWDSWLVAAAAWSNRSFRAEIRVVDGTYQGSTNRLVHSLSSPTTVNQLVTTQVLQISQRQRQRPHNRVCSGIYISSHTGRGHGKNHLAVRPSLAYGRTLPGRSRGPCSETPYSPRGHVASLAQSKRVCPERPTVQKLSFVGPEDRNREAPFSASQGTSSQ